LTTPTAYNDGQWHQVVASRGPAGMALYVDGALVGSNDTSTGVPFPGFWRVGGDGVYALWPSAPSAAYLTGAIDEVSTYSRALGADEVLSHWHASGR
jgi:hypothetical protein